jgi:hypothetical protein
MSRHSVTVNQLNSDYGSAFLNVVKDNYYQIGVWTCAGNQFDERTALYKDNHTVYFMQFVNKPQQLQFESENKFEKLWES